MNYLKTTMLRLYIVVLFLILPLDCFCAPLTYYIKESSTPNRLTVSLSRDEQHTFTKLKLRGISMGVKEQIENMRCNGKELLEIEPGIWPISSNCQELEWQIPLKESSTLLASDQQSLRNKDFILISEASSLPRLQDTESNEVIAISMPNVRSLFPKPDTRGQISLPARTHRRFSS